MGKFVARCSTDERFWSKVDKSGECWLWTGQINNRGYGRFSNSDHTKMIYAHRFAYELVHGPIPVGMQIDHVKARGCTHTNCVNPDHLEAVTPLENWQRGESFTRKQSLRTHCIRGHALDAANTYVWRNERHCRACWRGRDADHAPEATGQTRTTKQPPA